MGQETNGDSTVQQRVRQPINKIKIILLFILVGIFAVVIGFIAMYYLADNEAKKQIFVQEQLELAETAASEGKYDRAIQILKDLPNSDTDENIVQLVQKYEMFKLKEYVVVKLKDYTIIEARPDLGQYSDKFSWECYFTNNTDQQIKGLEITVIFSDMFGDEVKKAKCKFAKAIVNVGEGYEENFSLNMNSNDTRLISLVKEEILFDYYINTVVYEDGTKFLFDINEGYVVEANNAGASNEESAGNNISDLQALPNEQTTPNNTNNNVSGVEIGTEKPKAEENIPNNSGQISPEEPDDTDNAEGDENDDSWGMLF